MKKPKQLKKPKLPKAVHRPAKLWRKKSVEERVSDALSNVPRITNETVGDHREEVLSSARKYIYPLKQSKHRVVRNLNRYINYSNLCFFCSLRTWHSINSRILLLLSMMSLRLFLFRSPKSGALGSVMSRICLS